MNLLQEARELPLSVHRQFLHSHGETGFDLTETVAYVEKQLLSMGLQPKKCGKAGIMADIIGRKPKKIFLLRADMDALPITEETNLPFACKAGNMHACGHDLHTAMLMGAAQLLVSHQAELEGTVRLMFQPAEEILQGAADMIEAGVLDGVGHAMMLHVLTGSNLPTGTVMIPPAGISAPAADYFTIQIQGKGCHGAMPHTGIDPLIPACQILTALQTIQTRELPQAEPITVTIGSFHAGTAPNIIADQAVLKGTMRTCSEELRKQYKNRMVRLVTQIARAYRSEATVTFDTQCPTLSNDPAMVQMAEKQLPELLGNDHILSANNLQPHARSSGSEDFAFVSRKVPSLMLALAAGQKAQGYSFPAHHPKTAFDEEALPYGAAIYAWMGLKKEADT